MPDNIWISTSSGDFTSASNWSTGVAPANGDTLYFNSSGTASVTSNLGSTLTTITCIIDQSYPGSIGTISGSTFTYLTFDGGTIFIGQRAGGPGSQSGSPQIMIGNTGATAMTLNVFDSGSSSLNGVYPPILFKGLALTLNQSGGNAGIAAHAGATATLAAGRISRNTNAGVPTQLFLGRGATVTALQGSGGKIHSRSANTTASLDISDGAEYLFQGTGAHSTMLIRGGATCIHEGTGTITSLDVADATFDRSRDARALTITNVGVTRGARLLLDNGVTSSTTLTNGILYTGCALQDTVVTLPEGTAITL